MTDAKSLADNTHFSEEEAEILLKDRDLTGNPEKHSHPSVFVTDSEVIVETATVFNNHSKSVTSIELAFKSGSDVSTIRSGDNYFDD